ncbi:hypothetical protein CPT_Sansa10 [Caulobacter phage Sansa]|uniref:Uncharacterized protein n=1 Tax=Caulobacter phage Sansa TaxID=1675600 RepID=A0A0K1LLT9_9CAUD|nr:hypothetical protein HOR07_gp010 [Caulobacter phage Sansa]AKU43414.1 hypothetical protein CPT_Sansa10 [Caulobacter phage Sansa]
MLLDMAHRLRAGHDVILASQTLLQVKTMIADLGRHLGRGVIEGEVARWGNSGHAHFFALEPDHPRVADLLCITAAWCDELYGFRATRNQIGAANHLVRNLRKVVHGTNPKIMITGDPAWP